MARAGRGAARRIDALAGDRRASVCIVAGPGNNGGDGFVVAAELAARGHEVALRPPRRTAAVADRRARRVPALARRRRRRARRPCPIVASTSSSMRCSASAWRVRCRARSSTAARWINAHAEQVVALDVPSGLDSDRGAWVGDVEGVRADLTVTFLGDKPGLHTGAGIDAAGEVQVDRSRRGDALVRALRWRRPTTFPTLRVPRRRDTHKGSFGNVLVVGGGAGHGRRAAARRPRGPAAGCGPRLRRLHRRAGTARGSGPAGTDVPAARVDRRSRVCRGRLRAGRRRRGAVGARVVARASARARHRCRRHSTSSPTEPALRAALRERTAPHGADAASARSRAAAEDLRARRPERTGSAPRERSPATVARSSSSRAPAP